MSNESRTDSEAPVIGTVKRQGQARRVAHSRSSCGGEDGAVPAGSGCAVGGSRPEAEHEGQAVRSLPSEEAYAKACAEAGKQPASELRRLSAQSSPSAGPSDEPGAVRA